MTGARMDTPEAVAALAAHVCSQGLNLRSLSLDERCAAVAAAGRALMSPDHAPGQRCRERLPASTGLSAAMVDWALRTSLETMTADNLASLAQAELGREPGQVRGRVALPRLLSVILAGNVFTAALRPMILPLVAGVPVVCKASSRDDELPLVLAEALAEAHAGVGSAVGVLSFPGGTVALEQALLSHSDVLMVYGSDETVASLRARAPATVRLIEHGHGVSAAYVGLAALADVDSARAAARALALDTAAYDQRGCFSPHVVWVRRCAGVSAAELAALIHEALSELDRTLPRGPVPVDVAAAQMQWRGVAAATGELFQGAGHAVAWMARSSEVGPAPGQVRLGPGWRNLLVLECDGPAHAAALLGRFGVHLKAVGVACDHAEREELVAALPLSQYPRICPAGRMQTPPLHSLVEGAAELHALARHLSLE